MQSRFQPFKNAFLVLAFMRLLKPDRGVPALVPQKMDESLYAVANELISRFMGAQIEAEEFADEWQARAKAMEPPMDEGMMIAPDNLEAIARAIELVTTWEALVEKGRDPEAARKWLWSLPFEDQCCLKISFDLVSLGIEEFREMFRRHALKERVAADEAE